MRTLFAKRVPIPVTANQELFVNELVQLLPDLALLLPQLVPYSPAQALEPVQQKRRLFTVLTHFFSSQATQQPVLLIVEDIHWCDESSLDFLLYLIRHCTNLPLFLVFTYRNEENSPGLSHWLAQLDRERLALEIALKLLTLTEVDAMLQSIFAAPHPVPTELLSSIYTLTEGNPFYVEEMLKSLIATGELQYADGALVLRPEKRDASGSSFLPRSVQQQNER